MQKSGEPRFISIELTPKCNNACLHCYNYWRKEGRVVSGTDSGTLSREEIRILINRVKESVPLRYVVLSGGEPLLRKDLPQILGDLVDDGIQPTVITNGALLTDSLLAKLPSGIMFEVTLLGHNANLHDRLAGAKVFDKVVRNVSRINRHGSYLTTVFVATRYNALDIMNVYELALGVGAIGFMYNRVNLSSGMKSRARELMPPVQMLEESLSLTQEAVRQYGMPVFSSVPIPPCVLDLTKYPDLTFGWCPRGGTDSYYTIGCDGMLRPCNHSSLVLGDLREKSFKELVVGKKCRQFWSAVPQKCIECEHPLKDKCKGGCTAASKEFYGSQEFIDPFYEFSNGSQ